MQGQDMIYNKGFGHTDTARTKPVTTHTRFLIASVSKLIGSTLVMKLVEEGKLSLDQTLLELLPDFPNPDQAKKITFRHMISHTSGLQEYAEVIDSMYVKTGIPPTKSDFYEFFKGRELNFEPGTNYSYSNSGFLLMGMVVERITGNSLQEKFDRVINQPTGLDLKLIKEATNYPNMSDYWEKKDSTFITYPHWTWIKGDGGLTATPVMLAHFPGKWSSGKIISKDSYIEMITPMTLKSGIKTGYGLGVRNGEFYGEKIIGHTGGNKSTYSIMVYFPEKDLTFVVMMNTDAVGTSSRNIFGQMARTYFGWPEPDFSDQKIDHDNLTMYTGTYATYDSKMEKTVKIEIQSDNKLYYCYGSECHPMTYLGNHKFWISRWPYDHVVFEVNNRGESKAIKEYFTGFYAILRTKFNE